MKPSPIKSTYPFDPYDWTSITPLFTALSEANVSQDGFLDWLNQWNTLDIAVWDAYTQLKYDAYSDTRNTEAEAAYQSYVEQLYSTCIDITSTLRAKALTLQPEPPAPKYHQLWRRWHNQTELFKPASLPFHAKISQLEGRYRKIMNEYEVIDDNRLVYWMGRRDELNELMLQVLKARRSLAQTSGLPNFLAYRWRELNRLDYSIADCQAFHRAVEKMVPRLAEFRAKGMVKQAFPPVDDIDKLIMGVERILGQVDSEFGEIFQTMRNGYLDLGHRAHKIISNESWFFSVEGIPYIHVGSSNMGSILHESGHAFHDYLSFKNQGSLWNFNGPEVFQEFAATSLDMLCWPYYGQTQGGIFNPAEKAQALQNICQLYLGFCSTTCVMEDAFEHWIYGEAPEDVTPADLDAKWLELKIRFEPWDDDYASLDEKMTGWQRNTWSLFRMPLYLITYSMSMVATCLLGQQAQKNHSEAVSKYKRALSLGNTRTLPELFAVVDLEFPFGEEAVETALQFIFEQYAKTESRS